MQDILLPNASWKLVGEGYKNVSSLTVNPRGEVFFCDPSASRLYRIGTDGLVARLAGDPGAVRALTTGTDGRLSEFRLRPAWCSRWTPAARGSRSPTTFADMTGRGPRRRVYITSPGPGTADSKVWYLSARGRRRSWTRD